MEFSGKLEVIGRPTPPKPFGTGLHGEGGLEYAADLDFIKGLFVSFSISTGPASGFLERNDCRSGRFCPGILKNHLV